MKRFTIIALLGAILVGCATSPSSHITEEVQITDGDCMQVKYFSASIETLWMASIAACKDVGVTTVYTDGGEGFKMLGAVSRTHSYMVIMEDDDSSIYMRVIIERGELSGIIAEESVYEEFWAALISHL